LERFLNALERVPAAPKWDIVVADNGSLDGTAELLSAAEKRLPLVRVFEPRRGKSRALNAAIRSAEGGLLVFADDDIIPEPGWLSALYNAALCNP
jgi:glycosyltransferase involved in cell wall biosynthesis